VANTLKNERIALDQVQRLAAQSVLGIGATMFNALILAVLLLPAVGKTKIIIWLSVAALVSAIRILIHYYFKTKELSLEKASQRKYCYLISLAASGCVWGAAGTYLFPFSSLAHQVLLVFVLGGLVAGSVGVFASIMIAYIFFSIPTVLPIILMFFFIGDGIHFGMGLMTTLFWGFMFFSARQLNIEIRTFINLKYENIELIDDLEKEIKERKAAEEKLLKKNQQIESIVQTRTAELRQVNKKLLLEIDDRIEAERALRESEERFRELANSLPQIVFETDIKGNITFANRNAFKYVGYTEEDLEKGLSTFQVVIPEDVQRAKEKFHDILNKNKSEHAEFTARRKDGSTFPIVVHSTVVMKDNKPAGIRGLMIDLTKNKETEKEQKKLQVQLQRAQKMEVLGTMAGGVAHDLNNILSAIVSYPDLLLMQVPDDSPLKAPLLTMQESGKKAAAIVQDLLALTRRGVVSEEVLNLNDIVTEYLRSPENQKLMGFHLNVSIEQVLEPDLMNISGSRVHLAKAVMNLLSNAAEAMPDGGKITITTTNRYLDNPIRGYDDIEKGDYVVLTVADTGMGIAKADLERIFEPFFTKKVMGRSGTGLGMAVVWGTVKDHKGYIDVTSEEGRGSSVSIYFPVTRKKPALTSRPGPISEYKGNEQFVLVVDDVQEQRMIASLMLQKLGYQAHAVASGEEAVAYLEENRADLILLDMIMDPGMDGLETYKEIIKIHKNQKAVIASGYSETERVKEAQKLGAGPYLRKPYSLARLGQVVRSVLDENAN
jgi:PAS domain S-box-containing protein